MNTCNVENILNVIFMKMFQCYEFSKPEVNDENQVLCVLSNEKISHFVQIIVDMLT